MELLDRIKQNAKKHNKRIVLPEGYEERTIKAADIAIKEELAQIILIGDPAEINSHAAKLGLKNISKATIINPKSHEKRDHYIDMMVELRKSKGMTREEASKLIEDTLYLGVLMVKNGDADGEVSGADHSTGDVLRPAFHYIKTAPGISVVSGAFIMILPDKNFGENGVIIFADGAVHPNPNEKELAEIAVATAHTAKAIGGFEPREAMVEAFRERILLKTLELKCLNCETKRFMYLAGAPEIIKCHKCGQQALTIISKKQSHEEEEYNAGLIRAFGKRALIALSVYGIGPSTADRVLKKLQKDDKDFYWDLLEAQKRFIKNKKFWKP